MEAKNTGPAQTEEGGKRRGCRYPIVLVHGTGARDDKRKNCWGRIPQALRAEGARVYCGQTDAMAPIDRNAALLRRTVVNILRETGADKVNIIAHSKGGLDARHMISRLGMADRVASLTTISTPHRGSRTLDRIFRISTPLYRAIGAVVNLYFRLYGDKTPDFYQTTKEFTTAEAERFNRANPDQPGVYYQSYASVMRRIPLDMVLLLPYAVIRIVEGENDGLVTPASARWGVFQGWVSQDEGRGLSHADIVDLRQFGRRKMNICEFYAGIVARLREAGF